MSDPWNKNALGYGRRNDDNTRNISKKKNPDRQNKKDKDPWNKNAMGYGLKK